jgi:hypothetical protein
MSRTFWTENRSVAEQDREVVTGCACRHTAGVSVPAAGCRFGQRNGFSNWHLLRWCEVWHNSGVVAVEQDLALPSLISTSTCSRTAVQGWQRSEGDQDLRSAVGADVPHRPHLRSPPSTRSATEQYVDLNPAVIQRQIQDPIEQLPLSTSKGRPPAAELSPIGHLGMGHRDTCTG